VVNVKFTLKNFAIFGPPMMEDDLCDMVQKHQAEMLHKFSKL